MHTKIFRSALLLPLLWLAGLAAAQALNADWAAGRRIYLEGVLPNGQPLQGARVDIGPVSGAGAACVNCHRGSGLGQVEGNVAVPPISGRALFGGGDPVNVRLDIRNNRALTSQYAPYDRASFAAALRQGVMRSGKSMHALMPRYVLDDHAVQALEAYLKSLSPAMSPGVEAEVIHMATVIAPGVDPKRKQALLRTLQTAVNQMNINVIWGRHQKSILTEERRLRSRRRWTLDVWELTGPSTTWAAQLAERNQARPVFALLSGLGSGEWQPVQDFCEAQRVVCWFPSIDRVPEGAEQSGFSLYFSAGVALEAQVMASKLRAGSGRVVQLVAPDAVARAGAAALRESIVATAYARTQRTVQEVDTSTGIDAVNKALVGLGPQDAVVLWMRPGDIAQLTALSLTEVPVWVSATLGGGESLELPAALRQRATLVQPLELPTMRTANVERLQAWLTGSLVPLVDLRLQSEAYFAATSLQYTVRGMLNNLHTDYLIERAEATLSGFEYMQVQEEIQAQMMGPMNKSPLPQSKPSPEQQAAMEATSKAQLAHLEEMRMRGGTTVYPRLNLAQGQRFASKGAYLERLNPQGGGVVGAAEWVVP